MTLQTVPQTDVVAFRPASTATGSLTALPSSTPKTYRKKSATSRSSIDATFASPDRPHSQRRQSHGHPYSNGGGARLNNVDLALEGVVKSFKASEKFMRRIKPIIKTTHAPGRQQFKFAPATELTMQETKMWRMQLIQDEISCNNPFWTARWMTVFGVAPRLDESLLKVPWIKCDRYDLGISHAQRGQIEDAVKAYTQAVQIDTKYNDAYIARGCVLVNMAKYNQAIMDFRQALDLDPTNRLAQQFLDSAVYQEEQSRFLAQQTALETSQSGTSNAPKISTIDDINELIMDSDLIDTQGTEEKSGDVANAEQSDSKDGKRKRKKNKKKRNRNTVEEWDRYDIIDRELGRNRARSRERRHDRDRNSKNKSGSSSRRNAREGDYYFPGPDRGRRVGCIYGVDHDQGLNNNKNNSGGHEPPIPAHRLDVAHVQGPGHDPNRDLFQDQRTIAEKHTGSGRYLILAHDLAQDLGLGRSHILDHDHISALVLVLAHLPILGCIVDALDCGRDRQELQRIRANDSRIKTGMKESKPSRVGHVPDHYRRLGQLRVHDHDRYLDHV
ncbi:hypothetical protein BG004_004806 [Podila humilis]|nr:hypothetical protein BG004_004806 [Podila humilis]